MVVAEIRQAVSHVWTACLGVSAAYSLADLFAQNYFHGTLGLASSATALIYHTNGTATVAGVVDQIAKTVGLASNVNEDNKKVTKEVGKQLKDVQQKSENLKKTVGQIREQVKGLDGENKELLDLLDRFDKEDEELKEAIKGLDGENKEFEELLDRFEKLIDHLDKILSPELINKIEKKQDELCAAYEEPTKDPTKITALKEELKGLVNQFRLKRTPEFLKV